MDRDKITTLRHELDELDSHLIALIVQRNQIVAEIGRVKRDNNTSVSVPTEHRIRQSRFISSLGQLGDDIYTLLHRASVEIQNEIH